MSLKWYKNDASTEDICTIVESETTFNFDVFYAEGETDLDIILCYNMIIGGDSYLTKVEIECDEWDTTNPLDLYNFIGGCLDKFYGEESTTDERGKFNISLSFSATTLEIASAIKRLELELDQIRQAR